MIMEYKIPKVINQIHDKFDRLVELYLEVEKAPRRYGTDELLSILVTTESS